ncbi:hypothetical protein RB653_000548 [Dictyostelium firmibasis]|uniref:DH domain-containing protein n=1 Tax=Dictyostelium firmibasis TaxID=79012 RepID=A0AAN7U635_9MYCE
MIDPDVGSSSSNNISPTISISRVGMLQQGGGYDSIGSSTSMMNMDDTASNISGVSNFYMKSSLKNHNSITNNTNNNNSESSQSPKKKFGISSHHHHHHHHHGIHLSNIGGWFSMSHLQNTQKSFSDLSHKIFHGKGIKKLRNLKKKRRAKKSKASYIRRRKISKFMNSKISMIIMIVATLFLLYIDDLLYTTLAPNSPATFNSVSVLKVIVFFIFVVDLLFQIYVQRLAYILTLFFPIDLISIASLIPDVIGYIFGVTSLLYTLNSLSISRTARVARMASRLSRIARIINFFDVFQCGKRVREKQKNEISVSVEPSSIGKKLLGKTSHKIVVMCLLIVLITTLTSPAPDSEPYFNSILELLVVSANQNGLSSQPFLSAFNEIQENTETVDLLYLKINGVDVYHSSIDTDHWYPSWIIKNSFNGSDVNEMWVNNQKNEQYLAALSITMTTCLIIILSFGTLLISRDFQVLVIKPIERMISLIKKISSMERGYDSDYDSDHDDEYTNQNLDEDGADANGGGGGGGGGGEKNINMNDLEVGGFSSAGDSDFESFGEYGSEENETEILVEVLNELAYKKLNNQNNEKLQQESKQRLVDGLNSLIANVKAFSQRKHFTSELKVYNRRYRIVKELLTTEQTYCNSLATKIDVFIIPLRNKSIISNDDLASIFSNSEVIHQFNSKFLTIIEEKINNWSINQSIGEVFNYMDDAIQCYSTYVNNYNNSIKVLEDCKRDNEKFVEFLVDQRDKASIELPGYLIMPIQRMPRYVMLLEDLLKHTAPHHFDYETIDNAVKSLKKTTIQLNERKRESENKQSIQDIYMKLVPPIQDILTPGNCIAANSKLKQDSLKFHFILFQTGLLKVEKSHDELHVKQYYQIKDKPIVLTILQDVPSMKFFNAFQIRIEDEHELLLFAKTDEIRNQWVNALAQFTKVQTQRTKSVLMINSHLRKSTLSRGSGSIQNSPLSASRLSYSSGSGSQGGNSSRNLNK